MPTALRWYAKMGLQFYTTRTSTGINETIMRAIGLVLAIIATPALADVAGTASVIDGDTLEIHGQRIRFHGIDAPESGQLCHLDGSPWQCGKDAAYALADKINRRPVTCEDLGRDRYKRMVAKCTVAGEDLGEWMVVNGWAVAYYLYSYEYSRAEHRGKSARCGTPTPGAGGN